MAIPDSSLIVISLCCLQLILFETPTEAAHSEVVGRKSSEEMWSEGVMATTDRADGVRYRRYRFVPLNSANPDSDRDARDDQNGAAAGALAGDSRCHPNFELEDDNAIRMAETAGRQGSATHGRWFIDRHGRRLILRGLNVSGSCKLPMKPFLPSYAGGDAEFFNDLEVSFVGRPFPIEEADVHLSQIKSWGFNVLRLLITWEAVEHFGPGIYDDAYVDYLIALIRKATREYGIQVFIDPHQDVWSRHCGGSGAPNWTLRLAGLDARSFYETGAAICHSSWTQAHPEMGPEDFPKMIWPTNYSKLASATMFTLFFGGKTFAPRFVVSQAKTEKRPTSKKVFNVQDFLTFHFVQAMGYVAQKIADAGLNYSVDREGGVLGWDTLNEPDRGWIGCPDVTKILPWQELKMGPTPTPIDALRSGVGEMRSVETYRIAFYGPTRCGKTILNEKKVSAWRKRMTPQELFDEGMSAARGAAVTIDHSRMEAEGFKPSEPQPPMTQECIWASHGVYDPETSAVKIKNYFALSSLSGERDNAETFVEHFWMPFVFQLSKKLRSIHKDTIIFLQPPPYVRPPNLVERSANDLPSWFSEKLVYSPHWYDGLTLLMRRYSFFNLDYLNFVRGFKTMLSAICLGESSVRRGMRSQLSLILKESERVGTAVPTLIGEIGIPFNMPDMQQCAKALDANFDSLDRTLLSATLWNYCSDNDAVLGDLWNCEDLSIAQGGKLRLPEITVRPFPVATSGVPLSFNFDPYSSSFQFSFESRLFACDECSRSHPWSPPESDVQINDSSNLPPKITTEIFFPDMHYKDPNQFVINSTDNWVIDTERQVLKIFIGHPRILSETTRNPEPTRSPDSGSRCDCCLSPIAKEKLSPLWRKHSVEVARNPFSETDHECTDQALYLSWSESSSHIRSLKKPSIFKRFLRWIYRTITYLRLRWIRLRTRGRMATIGE